MGSTALAVVVTAAGLAFAWPAQAVGTVKGTVKDGSEQAIVGGTVYLVPAADVGKLAKEPTTEIRANVDNDEPMEDNLATGRDRYQQAMTDEKGAFSIINLEQGKYFVYVEPADRKTSGPTACTQNRTTSRAPT